MRRILAPLIVLSLALLFAGASSAQLASSAWPMFRHDKFHTGSSDEHAGPVNPMLVWSYVTGFDVRSSPAIGSDGSVYAGSRDNRLYVLDSGGILEWSYNTGFNIYDSSPALGADGRIYVGAMHPSGGSPLCVFTSVGTVAWSYFTGEMIMSSPVIGTEGGISFSSHDNTLYALYSSGSLFWSYRCGSDYSSPALALNGVRYVGSGDNRAYAISNDGTLKWSYLTGGPVASSPTVTSGWRCYVGSYDGRFYALGPDGSFLWSYRTAAVDFGIYSSAALGTDGSVCFGAKDNYFYSLTSNGSFLWSYATGQDVYSSPALDSTGGVYVGSNDNVLYAFSSHGTLLWSYLTGDEIHSSPALMGDGKVCAGSGDNVLYCIGQVPTPTPTPLVDVVVSSNSPAIGERFTVDATAQPVSQAFDAWGVIFGPGGAVYSFDLANPANIVTGAVPLATSVPGLTAPYPAHLLDLAIPPRTAGSYQVIVGLVPAGVAPTGPESAIGGANGYVGQENVTVR
ncbi:MAG: PQQ-binding-like beta-propeller repeat protein [Chlamydiota bacterium]